LKKIKLDGWSREDKKRLKDLLIMFNGRITFIGTSEELAKHEKRQKAIYREDSTNIKKT
jgi:hypothetical protein